MNRFFLVDQSLKGVGGHHFDYSCHVTRAAVERGYQVILGCHRKFRQIDLFNHCQVRPFFQLTTYSSSSRLVGIQQMVASREKKGFIGTRSDNSVKRDRQRRTDQFARDCEKFFSCTLRKNDTVFFTTLSDLELAGLVKFFAQRPDALRANWHLQFHFPLYPGRLRDDSIDLESIKKVFRQLQPYRQETGIHYYVTSETLLAQYNQLGFEFEHLAYPVNPGLIEGVEKRVDRDLAQPFRIACSGALRKEKSASLNLRELAGEIPVQTADNRPVQLDIQKKRTSLFKRIRDYLFGKREEELPDNVHPISFPLPENQYRRMIRAANIGLLTGYDSQTYFSRRAGILGEYLAAGVPVIVPGGCWLSDQIERLQQPFLKDRFEEATRQLDPDHLTDHSDRSTTVRFDLPEIESDGLKNTGKAHRQVIVGFTVHRPNGHGNYYRIKRLNPDPTLELKSNRPVDEQIVGFGHADTDDLVERFACFDLECEATSIEFRIANAFESHEWEVRGIRAVDIPPKERSPRSQVGLIAADGSQTACLVNEMVNQYEHYRSSAIANAIAWFRMHDPQRTIEMIEESNMRSRIPSKNPERQIEAA